MSSFDVLRGFKTILHDTKKKMIEVIEKSELSCLVCSVTKNTKKHMQLYR